METVVPAGTASAMYANIWPSPAPKSKMWPSGRQVLPGRRAAAPEDEQIALIGAHHQHPPQRIGLQHPRRGVVVLLMRIEAVELVARSPARRPVVGRNSGGESPMAKRHLVVLLPEATGRWRHLHTPPTRRIPQRVHRGGDPAAVEMQRPRPPRWRPDRSALRRVGRRAGGSHSRGR